MAYNPLLSINGSLVTDDGREISAPLEIRGVTNELANGSLRRYVKAMKKTWQISFQWLPGKAVNTTDGGMARNDLKTISEAISSHVFTVNEVSGSKTYIILVDSYEETLIRRDPVLDDAFYNVTLGLKEV